MVLRARNVTGTSLRRVAAFSLLASVALGVQPLYAQDEEDEPIEEIVVTGSHIVGADVEGTLPVTVMSFEDIESTGATVGDELLRAIPQFGSVGMGASRGGITGVNAARGDVASFNLRSIGDGNTLVLINGRRMVLHPITQTSSFDGVPVASANANTLPVAALSRVEVLRDGAGALYGADAVGGVVNYVLNESYDGAELNVRYGAESGTDRDDFTLNGAFGTDFNGGATHIVLSGSYTQSNGLTAAEKSYAANQDLRGLAPEGFDTTALDQRSSLEPHAQVNYTGFGSFHVRPVDLVRDNGSVLGVADCGGNGLLATEVVFNDGVQDLCFDTGSHDRALRPNRNETRTLVPDIDRVNLFAKIGHDLDNGWEVYGEGSYYYSKAERFWEQAAILSNGRFFVPADYYWNPLGPVTFDDGRANPNRLPGLDPAVVPVEGLGFQLTSVRPTDIGPRRIEVEGTSYRILGGMKGDLGDWNVDTAVWYSRAEVDDTANNRISTPLFQQSFTLDTPDAYNIFTGVNPANPASIIDSTPNPRSSIDPFIVSATRNVVTTLTAFDFRASRPDLFSLPAGEVGAALGVEFRSEDLDEDNSAIFDGTMPFIDPLDTGLAPGEITNASSLQGSSVRPDVAADRDVVSVYAEFLVPITETLEAQVAARFEDFDDVGNITRPKLALAWTPTDWLRVRGAYSEGFRAPNLIQLNSPPTSITTSVDDYAEGILLGTGDLDDGPANGNYILTTAGNTDLGPEESEQISFGIVLTPTDALTFSVDWWEIETEGTVGVFSDENESRLDAVLRAQGSSNPAVIRAAPDAENPLGEIVQINRRFENLNQRTVSGIDYSAQLDLDTGAGYFSFKVNAANLMDFDQAPGGNAAILVAAGANPAVLGASVGSQIRREFFPEWRTTISTTWNSPSELWAAGVFVSHVSDVFEPGATSSITGDFLEVDSMTTTNVYLARYDILGPESSIRVGINNVTDEDPPLAREAFGFEGELHSSRAFYPYVSVKKRF